MAGDGEDRRFFGGPRALGALLPRLTRPAFKRRSPAGAALMAGSACLRFGVFDAGQASARDPRYTVVPQRERLAAGKQERHPGGHPTPRPSEKR